MRETNARYRKLRADMIQFFSEHYLPPDSAVEASYMANRMNEFAAEMDAIASESLAQTVSEFQEVSDVPRTTEAL